jgi:hypothetical protein
VTPDARVNALDMIASRCNAKAKGALNDAQSRGFCERIVRRSDDKTVLLVEAFDVLGRAVVALRTERGRLAMWVAVSQMAEDERGTFVQRQAANLILSFGAISFESQCGDECTCAEADQLADWGDAEWDRIGMLVHNLDKTAQVVIAVVDVFLELLPELPATGTEWLATLQPQESET